MGCAKLFGCLAENTVQDRAWCPKFRHFLHWFGKPKYRILCLTEFVVGAPSAIEGILMKPANLVMSPTSTVTMGPAGLFMYDSAASIFRTVPSLLTMMVSALTFLNCSWISRNCTLIVCVRSNSAPFALESKSEENLENERLSPLQSTVVSFLAAMAPPFSNSIRK
ncbi:unnamed protein product [Sphagnum troendelagicum]|uniref:Uncharacterized protein n=1 Tax=Sphagnum troendelagicum TaxID=128251 RepID=A0ABP0TZ30_9BRYO